MTTDAAVLRRNLLTAVPFLIAVPIMIGLVAIRLGIDLRVGPLIAGAVGWIVALVLRAPVAAIAMRRTQDRERAQPIITAASGPLEEVVRLVFLLLLGRDVNTAVSLGLGWAAVEVVYAIASGFAVTALVGRTDPEAEQARALLPPMMLSSSAPWWGVVERIWASLLHIGFTLIVAAQPILVIATAIVHSATNMLLMREIRRGASPATINAAGAVLALAVVSVGAWLIGR